MKYFKQTVLGSLMVLSATASQAMFSSAEPDTIGVLIMSCSNGSEKVLDVFNSAEDEDAFYVFLPSTLELMKGRKVDLSEEEGFEEAWAVEFNSLYGPSGFIVENTVPDENDQVIAKFENKDLTCETPDFRVY